MLSVAMCGPRSAVCLFEDGASGRVDYRWPDEEIGVDPDHHAKELARPATRLGVTLERWQSLWQRTEDMSDEVRAAFLDAGHDTQTVTDHVRRFGAWYRNHEVCPGVIFRFLVVDMWRIIPVPPGPNPIAVEREAVAGLSVDGDCVVWPTVLRDACLLSEAPRANRQPILSPAPTGQEDVAYACPVAFPQSMPDTWLGPQSTREAAIEVGANTIAQFLRRLADCIDLVEKCGS